MIKKLKFKLVILASSAILTLLAIILLGINLMNYAHVMREADELLHFLAEHKGAFPSFENQNPPKDDKLPPHMSPELPYQSRYFSVLLDENGKVLHTDISRIASVTHEEAAAYALKALSENDDLGIADHFRFYRYTEGSSIRIIFLNCERQLADSRDFLITSMIISSIAFAAVFLVLCFLAHKIIRPIAESHEKQKRFIADAGHEIKTPLTVINANTDLLELDVGENESIEDIRQQTKRLRRLTDDLVYLARMEESGATLTVTEFPISDIVSEALDEFDARIRSEKKILRTEITPLIAIRGNVKGIEQLVSILADNALKYSPEGSEIEVSLSRSGRSVTLTMINTTEYLPTKDEFSKLFDRFYRTDPSRNSQTGGHGIGLSIAKAIVTAHNGKISASADPEGRFKITVTLPVQ